MAEPIITVELKYQGPRQSAFAVTSPLSGARYEIDGRGAQFLVDPADADWFESLSGPGGPEYVRISRQGEEGHV